ncbi:MAG: hypothetical protein KR126chlam3_00817 [Chlamydiae bacterium]|nr:hypothetical protein [Chlamydiota bacterium]
MISAVSHDMFPQHFHEQGGRVCSSFCGRIFSLSWDKAHLLANLVLVVAGIAYAFFMKLPPMIMFSLGLYGCLVTFLYAKAQKSRPSQSDVENLAETLAIVTEQHTLKEKNFKAEMSAQDASGTLREDVETYSAKVDALAARKGRLEREIGELQGKRKSLKKGVDRLDGVMKALGEEFRKANRGTAKWQALRELKVRLDNGR